MFTSGAATRGNLELIFVGSMDWLPNEDAVCWFSQMFSAVSVSRCQTFD